MDPPVRMGVVVTSILHESIHGLLYFYLSHFILQSVRKKTSKNMTFRQWLRPSNYRLRTKLIITYILLTVVPMSILVSASYQRYAKSIEESVAAAIA